MYCPNCHTQTEGTHNYCPHCGYNFSNQSNNEPGTSLTDILLTCYIGFGLFVVLFNLILTSFISDWYLEPPYRYIYSLVYMISYVSLFLVAFSIKNNILKIIGLIISLFLAGYGIYSQISFLTLHF